MADLLVRNLEETVVRRLREEAVREGISTEEAHRRLLRRTLLGDSAWQSMTIKELLSSMPDLGDDIWLELERQRREDKPRPVDLS